MVQLGLRDAELVERSRRLLNRELGEEIYPADDLAETALGARSAVFAAVSPEGADPLGAGAVRLLQPGDEAYYDRFGELATRFAVPGAASLEAMAVEPSARRRGIGKALIEARLTFASKAGAPSAVAVSWLSGRPDASEGLFARLGFERSPDVPEFYLEESARHRWTCPVCGGPCHCAAALFGRTIRWPSLVSAADT